LEVTSAKVCRAFILGLAAQDAPSFVGSFGHRQRFVFDQSQIERAKHEWAKFLCVANRKRLKLGVIIVTMEDDHARRASHTARRQYFPSRRDL